MDVEDIDDEEFLNEIGARTGVGNQGDVYNFSDDLAVKVWRRRDYLEDILNEVNIAKLAGDYGCAPMIFDFRDINGSFYMVMEKVTPVKLKQSDYREVITLFRKLIKLKIVNYDGSFGRNDEGNLVLFDYGVAKITGSPAEAERAYCDEDYFWGFADFLGVQGVYDYFCKKKSPKSPSPRVSPKKKRSRKN